MKKIVHDFDWSKAPQPWCWIGAQFREQCHGAATAPVAPREPQRGGLARTRRRLYGSAREQLRALLASTTPAPSVPLSAPVARPTEEEVRAAAVAEIVRASR